MEWPINRRTRNRSTVWTRAPIAQSVEHLPLKQGVEGSSPSGRTKIFLMKKIFFLTVVASLAISLLPIHSFAQTTDNDEIFQARVTEILEEKTITDEAGEAVTLQKLQLKGLEGTWKDQEIIFDGTAYEVITANQYKVGDKVMAVASVDNEGNNVFYVTDYVRQSALYWLAALFAVVVIAIGRLKGLRAIVVLILTFIIILAFVLPLILQGKSPLLISIIGAVFILVIAIYLTEGLQRNSTIAVASITIALIITGLLSVWFTHLARLTGFASEETFFLKNMLGADINIQGLLLAGIIIGALGVLDDVVVAQVATVNQLKQANPNFTKKELYSKAMEVGITHMSAMVNTLFLAYAGAALPILLLFTINEPPYHTFSQTLNNELIATEIVRTLTGSIGLMLAIPLATLLSVQFVRLKKIAPGVPHQFK